MANHIPPTCEEPVGYQLREINRRIDQDVKGFLEETDASMPPR